MSLQGHADGLGVSVGCALWRLADEPSEEEAGSAWRDESFRLRLSAIFWIGYVEGSGSGSTPLTSPGHP